MVSSPSQLPAVSARQLKTLQDSISSPRWTVNEQLWTFLAASLIAEAPERFIPLFCGEVQKLPAGGRVVCEAEPISTRSGVVEGNTVLDIAFGHIAVRRSTASAAPEAKSTLAGITYEPQADDSWACFVEAKYLSDCDCKVTHDPLRNQLTRIIENLLCFQSGGKFPNRLYFALLTPRVFRDTPTARLYGYKMRDYQNPTAVLADVQNCTLEVRSTNGYCYPAVGERLESLAPPRWVTFEDVLQQGGLGEGLDIVRRTNELLPVHAEIVRRLEIQQQHRAGVRD